MNEKKQNSDRELARGKVDLVLANLNFVYFFLACVSLSDVAFSYLQCALYSEQPYCRHSAFLH